MSVYEIGPPFLTYDFVASTTPWASYGISVCKLSDDKLKSFTDQLFMSQRHVMAV